MKENVFIRSLAEMEPIQVFILADSVKLPKHALQPIEEKQWMTHHVTFKKPDFRKLGRYFLIELPSKANKNEPIKVSVHHPMIRKGRVVEGYMTSFPLKENDGEYEIIFEHDRTCIRVDFYAIADQLDKRKVPRTKSTKIKVDFVAE